MRGGSGRIVIEIAPDLKRDLYSVLALENLTLKDWFVAQASRYIAEHREPPLPQLDNGQ